LLTNQPKGLLLRSASISAEENWAFQGLPPERISLFFCLGQFTRNYTQTTKRGLLTTNKG